LTLGGHGVEGAARLHGAMAYEAGRGALGGRVGAPGECGLSHNTSVNHETP